MKQFILKCLSLALVVTMAAGCDSDNNNDFEQLGLYPLTGGATVLYADQTEDSITVVSSRAWILTADSAWMGLRGEVSNKTIQGQPTAGYQTSVNLECNNTGNVRVAAIRLTDNHRTVGRIYLQTYWLDIEYPEASFPSGTPEISNPASFNNVTFALEIPRDSTGEYIDFTIHASQARLSTDASWISPREVTTQRGSHSVKLECAPNTTGSDRSAVYTLTTSNGISTPITVIQKGR